MVTSALAVVMSRPGTALDVRERAEQVLVDADGHDVHACRAATLVVGVRCRRGEFSRHRDDARSCALATRVCILVKAYQRAFEKRCHGVSACSISRRRSTVIG